MTKTRSQAVAGPNDEELENSEQQAGPVQSDVGSITMSNIDMTTLLSTLQQSQHQFYQEVLREVRSSTPVMSANASASFLTTAPANFSGCTSKFCGGSTESLESFIDAIEAYKSCLNISDDNALRGLTMLLTETAAVWWQGIKANCKTWDEALLKLRSAFGERRPPFRIYQDLFALSQGDE
ncbi:Retrovirus-related Pol polyprotein from transposon 17.6, partial [Operophtera brumata]